MFASELFYNVAFSMTDFAVLKMKADLLSDIFSLEFVGISFIVL